MDYFLDVPDSQFDTVNDLMKSRTDVVPFDSYPHPNNSNFHRMQFEEEDSRNAVQDLMRRNNIECYQMNGRLTSTGLFV